ncbi:APH(3')-II family aminoglycoside O-phosphotransferase [Sinorhizobium meliloti]|uniref:APH(3')-II family aminoglycoside O-phosphotransferase n=1 Tax=Rhizobium meliloti TaxID=382 RepID=UPI000FDA576B|nr:APH(3') family aminoglycoside O-phosphotransferase [Sinorhizobium meliloti]MDW9541742.1 APH(3') family aminoglycoside O-phosphotransferase [Sinorhizobium meliloti]RVK32272.1 aminoglycoside 3'-phosphotransferase [Sinorhizobium meliloti]
MDVRELDLPPAFRGLLSGYGFERDALGQSASTIFLLKAQSRPFLILKHEPSGPFTELTGEAARLHWLAAQDMPCPRVLGHDDHAGETWLLLEAAEGMDLASCRLPHPERIAILAEALRRLHRLDPAACPFDRRLTASIAAAKARMEAGLVDESDFDEERQGRQTRELFDELLARRPKEEQLVVTHGDACLPNFIAAGNQFSGFIDCGRLGVADIYQDLALACWSITHNLGEEWVAPFLDRYGLAAPDPEKLAFYRLLDEFF